MRWPFSSPGSSTSSRSHRFQELGSLFDSRAARVGLYLGPLFATFYGFAGILTADLPNIISESSQSIAGHTISWSEWWPHMYIETRELIVTTVACSVALIVLS